MPTIKLTDQLGLEENIRLADSSAMLQYFRQLPSLRLDSLDLSKLGGLTLDQPAVTSLNAGVAFDRPIPIGAGSPALSIQAGAHGSFAVSKGPSDVLAEDVDAPENSRYVSFGIDASVGAEVTAGQGSFTFGIKPGATVAIVNYRNFPLHQGVTLFDALKDVVGGYVIPARIEDLEAMPAGSLATITGTGSLTLSVTANLLAVTNPLASVSLPAPLPSLSVSAGGKVTVGASYQIACRYQICGHKLASGKVRLGWYREQSSEIDVTATAVEGVSAGLGSTDLISSIVGTISANPAADLNELAQAGLSAEESANISRAVKAAVQRKLELALSAELSSSQSQDAVFLYEIDLAGLTPESRAALEQALRGDLSALHAGALPGISCVKSVWETAHTKGVTFRVNLLGILNVRSVATLTRTGKVLFDPATGALVITDKASAERIRSTQVNFGADTQKLRQVMSESFLITVVYQGAQRETGGPALRFSHNYFDLENQTDPSEMARMLRTGLALGLFSAQEADLPQGIHDFGRTMIHATTEYDNGLANAIFLDANGGPMPREFYERKGRDALQYLVKETDVDAVRLRPASDDSLWAEMKDRGQPGFPMLFPSVPAPLVGAITADYSTIVWWADAMAGAAQRLAAIRQWFDARPSASLDDAAFQKLRGDLSNHLLRVTATTKEEFGQPWGLLAMNEAANRRPGATIVIAGPKLVRTKERPLAAVANP
jgi:hypothetical protein